MASPAGPRTGLAGVLHRSDLRVVLAITLIGLILRLAFLGSQSFWFDEIATVEILQLPFEEMVRALKSSETAPPLYYVLAWFWSRVVGSSELTLRLLSALVGTLVIPVAYMAGRELSSRRAGLIVAALAASSPLLVWYSQEARAYSLLVLLSGLSLLTFARAWRTPERRHLVLWTIFSCLAVATYYFAIYLVVAEAGLLLFRHGRRRQVLVGAAAVAATIVLLAPLAILQGRGGNASWIHSIPLQTRVEEALRQLLTPTPAPPWGGAGRLQAHETWILAAALLAGTLFAGWRFGDRQERRGAMICLGLAGAVIVTPLITSVIVPLVAGARGDTFLYRALLPAWLPLTIVVATGLAVRRAGRVGIAGVAILVAASVALTITIAVRPSLQRDDWRGLASATTGRGLVLVYPPHEARVLLHYRPDLKRPPLRRVVVDEVELISRSEWVGSENIRLPASFVLVDEQRLPPHWKLSRFHSGAAVPLDRRRLSEPDVTLSVLSRPSPASTSTCGSSKRPTATRRTSAGCRRR